MPITTRIVDWCNPNSLILVVLIAIFLLGKILIMFLCHNSQPWYIFIFFIMCRNDWKKWFLICLSLIIFPLLIFLCVSFSKLENDSANNKNCCGLRIKRRYCQNRIVQSFLHCYIVPLIILLFVIFGKSCIYILKLFKKYINY